MLGTAVVELSRPEEDNRGAPSTARPGRLVRVLDAVERIGNRLPDPMTLFAVFAVLVVIASAVAARAGVSVRHPATGETVTATSLLTAASLRRMLTEAVKNFALFPPLGTVLVTMIGVGVAEKTGLFAGAMRALVGAVPRAWLTAAVVFAGVNASAAADAGLVVLPPLAAALFAAVGRHPLAGLAAAFAGVTGGFSANLAVTALDPLLSGLTESAARLVEPAIVVAPTCNYYFMVVSTFVLTAAGTLVTARWVEPRLGAWHAPEGAEDGAPADALAPLTVRERRALWAALAALLGLAALVAALALPAGGLLRDEHAGLRPLFDALVLLVMGAFLVPGIAYGLVARTIRSDKDVARMAADTMSTMGAYIVLAFFAAQFVAYFGWSNLGIIVAVKGAAGLRGLGLTGLPLVVGFVVFCAVVNLLIASASAKWAVLSVVFVPMLMLLGYSPAFAQVAYRVGDSLTNPITPLLPYFPILIAFARKYEPRAGLGTLVATTLPYSIGFSLVWIPMLVGWHLLGLPLGPAAPIHYAPPAPLAP
jgi:aminobenzoyl-glutamate transport protein